jgi:NtrC-family two-component system sensor histidine kinase KinB
MSHLAIVVVMGLVMGGAIIAFFSLGQSIDRLLQDNFQSLLGASRFKNAIAEQNSAFSLLVTGDVPGAQEVFQESERHADQALDLLRASVTDKDQADLVADMTILYRSYRGEANEIFERNLTTIQPDTAIKVTQVIRPALKDLRAAADSILSQDESQIRDANAQARSTAKAYFMQSLGATLIALLLALLLGLRQVRLALVPLAVLAKHAEKIAQGNLEHEVKVPRSDEIGALADSFNEMARRLAEVRRSEVRRLQRAQLMSDAALESLYDPIVVTDARQRVVYLNRAAIGLFGVVPLSPRKPLAEHISDRRIVKAMNAAVNDSVDRDENAPVITVKIGDMDRHYRLRANPMRDESGHLLGSVAVLEDITHLTTIDRLKTEFIGVASHELRTPVTSLLLSAQLLLEGAVGELNEAQREVVLAQLEDLNRLEKLMRDLLDVTRLEAGSSPPRFELVTPEELVRSPVSGLRSQAAKKGVELTVDVASGLSEIRADRGQLGRVLTNLISNAIRHTPAGGKVSVSASESSNEVTFAVEDNGAGIPEEYLKLIFDRFVQVPGATQGGAGLGLSIASSIVRAHGGTMSVESKLGKGSKFSFVLPRASLNTGKDED